MKELPELSKYRGFNRVLLLFAPERTHPSYIDATQRLSDQLPRVEEKEIKILSVFGSGRVYDNHDRVEDADEDAIRRHFGAHRSEFTAVLLDSEGNEILRQEDALDVVSVLGRIPPGEVPPPGSEGPR